MHVTKKPKTRTRKDITATRGQIQIKFCMAGEVVFKGSSKSRFTALGMWGLWVEVYTV